MTAASAVPAVRFTYRRAVGGAVVNRKGEEGKEGGNKRHGHIVLCPLHTRRNTLQHANEDLSGLVVHHWGLALGDRREKTGKPESQKARQGEREKRDECVSE